MSHIKVDTEIGTYKKNLNKSVSQSKASGLKWRGWKYGALHPSQDSFTCMKVVSSD